MGLFGNFLMLLIGFVFLVKGADYFVEGSSAIAKLLKIPSIVVGLTVVSLGTSLPELAVSVTAAMNGSNEIAMSNVSGSNLFNLLVALGACAVVAKVPVTKDLLKREYPFSIFAIAALLFMCADKFIPWAGDVNEGTGVLSRFDGIILIILCVLFLYEMVKHSLRERTRLKEAGEKEEEAVEGIGYVLSFVFIICGIVAIKFGGQFVVDSAKEIAYQFGMGETLVGLTIVALGTSLPELATSIVAAMKKETELAIGNVVGSNILNVLLILGVSGTIKPVTVVSNNLIDIAFVIIASLVVFFFAKTKLSLSRREGIIMIGMYVAYMVYAVLR